jgi:hypothetical protein
MMRLAAWALAVAMSFPAAGFAGEMDELGALVDDFLANADQRAAHERFWDDELVYTSSSGARFGKDEILAGMSGDDAAADGPVYSARDVDIRLYGEMAVVAFRLVATAADGSEETYFNTGTFRRGERGWQAVAWQATRIPTDD